MKVFVGTLGRCGLNKTVRSEARTIKELLPWFEREVISGAVQEAGGSVSGAARVLGCSTMTLYTKRKRLGLA